ncbi:MAG: TMEM175 family protein [Synechococcus sp.]|nr:TMEM175 family protein [Synechococcus sp.]
MTETRFNRRLRLHTVRVSEVLPFYDSVFAAAFTLLAYNLPDHLIQKTAVQGLTSSLWIYSLAGVAVCIYWFKLRRLMLIDRWLQPQQLALVVAGLIGIVLLPKLFSLVLRHGAGSGDLLQWTAAQLVNTLCLGFLVLFNLVALLYALSLQRRRLRHHVDGKILRGIIATQVAGLLFNLVLVALQLSFTWFDTQYVYALPITLLIEEVITASQAMRLSTA